LVFGNSKEGLQTAKYLNLLTSQATHYTTATALPNLCATEFEGKLISNYITLAAPKEQYDIHEHNLFPYWHLACLQMRTTSLKTVFDKIDSQTTQVAPCTAIPGKSVHACTVETQTGEGQLAQQIHGDNKA